MTNMHGKTRLSCTVCGGEHYRHMCPDVRKVRHCVNCVFLQREDCGYSNWTVTETLAVCLAKQQVDTPEIPYGVSDEPHKWKWGMHALQCDWYINGDGPHTDVDGEDEAEHARVKAISAAVSEGFAAALAAALGLYQPKEKSDE